MLFDLKFVVKAGVFLAALLFAVPRGQAQFPPRALGQIDCVLTAVPPLTRAAGLADVAGAVHIFCVNDGDTLDLPGPHTVQTYVEADISMETNTNVTSRIDFGSGPAVTDAVLVVGDNESAATAPMVASTLGGPDPKFPVPGAPLNTASPPAICGPATCMPSAVTFEIKNVRIDSTAFGIPLGGGLPSVLPTGTVAISSAASISLGPPNVVTIGVQLRGVLSSSSPGAGAGDVDINIEEGFATAFKVLGSPDMDFPGQTAESGYGVPGSLDATQGTRIIVDFVDETPGGSISVPNEFFAFALKILRVDAHDANGAGGTIVGGAGSFLIDTSSGFGRVVYEVTSSDPFLAQSATLAASLVPAAPEDIRISVMLGPVSTVNVADGAAPAPRFAEVSLPVSIVSDGTVTDGGTVNDDDSDASVTFPPGTTAEVTIDVVDAPFSTPPPAGFTSVGTGFVNITVDPSGVSYCPTGLIIVLPVDPPLPAGTSLPLLKVNPVTGILEVVNDCGASPLAGTVDPGGATATFSGVPSFSLIVGLLPEGPVAGSALITLLISDVEALVANGELGKGLAAPLIAFLDKAVGEVTKDKTDLAVKFLRKFIERVEFLVDSEALDPAAGQELIDAAEAAIQGLG